MVDVNGTVYHLRTDMCTMGKRLMLFCMAPQWGSNSKDETGEVIGTCMLVSVPAMGK